MTERKYALVKINRGDYLLPSNDARTLWRISDYDEDGSATMDGRTLRGTYWQTAKYRDPLPTGGTMPADFLEWDRWETWEVCIESRKAAIESALRA